MRTKNSLFNTFTNILFNLLTVFFGLLNRKMLISTLGVDYQGASGLFTNILSVLAIADAGMGNAIMFHLYQPIAEDNTSLIRSLLKYYRNSYIQIGLLFLAGGVLCIPILSSLILIYTLAYPVGFIYLWFLFDAVCSYFFMYKRASLIASQKNYIVMIYESLYLIATKSVQIVFLFLFHNFIIYLAIMLIFRVIENILISHEAQKRKPEYFKEIYNEKYKLSDDIKTDIHKKVKGALYGKVSQAIFNGTDNILLSKFFGLSIVGTVSNFQMIITVLQGLCSSWSYSFVASIGNMLVSENRDNSYMVFKEIHLVIVYFLVVGTTGFTCVSNDIIALIFGDQYTLEYPIIYAMAASFYIYNLRAPYDIFKSAAGIVYEDRYVPLVEAFTNLIVSLALVKHIGIPGIFYGTAISSLAVLFYSYPIYVNKFVFNKKLYQYIRRMLISFALPVISITISENICSIIDLSNSLSSFCIKGICSVIISSLVVLIGYALWVEETRALVERLKKLLKR